MGPRAELEKAGVPVLIDAPEVGRHLKDHLSVGMAFVWVSSNLVDLVSQRECLTDGRNPRTCRAKEGISSQWVADPLKGLPPLVEWLKNKTGPLTSNVSCLEAPRPRAFC